MLHKNANIHVEKPVGDPKKKKTKKHEACGILVKYKPGVNFVFSLFPFARKLQTHRPHIVKCAFPFSPQVREIQLSRKEN